MDEEETRLLSGREAEREEARRGADDVDRGATGSPSTHAARGSTSRWSATPLEDPELLAELAKEVERRDRRLSGAAFTEAAAVARAARAAGFAPTVSRDGSIGGPDATAASGQLARARPSDPDPDRERCEPSGGGGTAGSRVTRVNSPRLARRDRRRPSRRNACSRSMRPIRHGAHRRPVLLAIAAAGARRGVSERRAQAPERAGRVDGRGAPGRQGSMRAARLPADAVGGVIVFTTWTTAAVQPIAARADDSWASVMTVAFAERVLRSTFLIAKIVGRVPDDGSTPGANRTARRA